MNHYTNDNIFTIDELNPLIQAATIIGKLDERVSHEISSESFYFAPIIKDTAISISSLEGSLVRMESLCRLLGNREATNLDRAVRFSTDIHDAITITRSWDDAAPSEAQIREMFTASETSSGRRMTQDLVWSLEEDCQWLRDEMVSLIENPSAPKAIETIRAIWNSGRFLGNHRRISMLMSGWILARGFSCSSPILGLPIHISKDTEGFRDASNDQKTWLIKVSESLNHIGLEGIGRIENGAASKLSMMTLCPSEKTSSSVERAIEYMLKSPVFTARSFADALKLTPRGAKVVLDKLEDKNVVEVDGGSRNRNFVCRRAM